jgi:pilus assembly protein CpaF
MQILEPVRELLEQPEVTDVLISGSKKTLVERAGQLQEVSNVFESEEALRNWAVLVIRSGGGRIDISKPISEVSLNTDWGLLRFHCVLGGECSVGTQISIRRHSSKHFQLSDLVATSFLSDEQLVILKQILIEKSNFVIVGGTGTGKTTLLRALMNDCSAERIITIEDSPELELSGNAIALKTRMANHEEVGAVTTSALLREALRMRPDRLVIGEVRGEELLVLLQALNTGHSGSGFTLHANSIAEVGPRMLAILAGVGMQPSLAKVLISASVNWTIEVKRMSAGREVVAIERLVINHE